jgi:hypothetical protein
LWRLLLLLLLALLIGCSGARVLLRAASLSALSSYFGRRFRDLVVDILFAVFFATMTMLTTIEQLAFSLTYALAFFKR